MQVSINNEAGYFFNKYVKTELWSEAFLCKTMFLVLGLKGCLILIFWSFYKRL